MSGLGSFNYEMQSPLKRIMMVGFVILGVCCICECGLVIGMMHLQDFHDDVLMVIVMVVL